jgi:DNA-binding transcriptional regulator LsrR (DeoR family)
MRLLVMNHPFLPAVNTRIAILADVKTKMLCADLKDEGQLANHHRHQDKIAAGQVEIAERFHVSRQTVQRLVAMATKAKLIRFRLEHPMMRRMDLAKQLTKLFKLRKCAIVQSV